MTGLAAKNTTRRKHDEGGWARAARTTAATAAMLVLAACGSRYAPERVAPLPDAGVVPEDPFGSTSVCSSGSFWDPNLQDGPEMAPGRACVSCHAEENALTGELDAPLFGVAGTIYPTAHEPDLCRGSPSEGAVVEVVDGAGRRVSLTANVVGNFFLDDEDLVLPLSVAVTFEGRTRRMFAAAPSGDCNACHTQAGAALPGSASARAPGRIVLP